MPIRFYAAAVVLIFTGFGCSAVAPGSTPSPSPTEAPVTTEPTIACSGHGTMTDTGYCVCNAGFSVPDCSKCLAGYSGPLCLRDEGTTTPTPTTPTPTTPTPAPAPEPTPEPTSTPTPTPEPTKLSNGQACTSGSECTSGFCLGTQSGAAVCSAVSSCGSCQVVNTAGTSCVAASVGSDPKSDCEAELATSCGNTGMCDGAGACQKYASGTMCGSAQCGNDGFVAAPACNGSGSCVTPAATSCDDGNACTNDSCSITSGCSHATVSCSDGNECTADSCNESSGCVFEPLSGVQCGAYGQCGDGICYE